MGATVWVCRLALLALLFLAPRPSVWLMATANGRRQKGVKVCWPSLPRLSCERQDCLETWFSSAAAAAAAAAELHPLLSQPIHTYQIIGTRTLFWVFAPFSQSAGRAEKKQLLLFHSAFKAFAHLQYVPQAFCGSTEARTFRLYSAFHINIRPQTEDIRSKEMVKKTTSPHASIRAELRETKPREKSARLWSQRS